MSTYICPKGHASTESDYCSECGVKINGNTGRKSTITTAITTNTNVEICPDCSAVHEPDSGQFCEICGYNFVTGSHGEVPITPLKTPSKLTNNPTVIPPSTSSNNWQIIVTIDPFLRLPESPEPPTNQPPLIFNLEKSTNLIGRNSQAKANYPEIALDFDNAISHRHAVLNLQPDGTLILRDIGSSNGTIFKGKELKPMVDVNLQDGDEFTLGHWTKITIKSVQK
jgi:hypothetical protein